MPDRRASAPKHLNVGLRFAREDAMLLSFLGERVRNGEIPGEAEVFTKAADAARTGEPLLVQCQRPEEAIVMAQMYATLGCTRPTVEALPDWAKPR